MALFRRSETFKGQNEYLPDKTSIFGDYVRTFVAALLGIDRLLCIFGLAQFESFGLSMNTPLHKILRKSKTGDLFQVRRRIKDVGTTTGFIVGFSDSLLLFHTLNMDTFRLNGYTVLREADISQFRVFKKSEYWQAQAVKHLRLEPMRLEGVALGSLSDLLQSVAGRYPLVTFHQERKNDVCYIGPVSSMTEKTVTIEDLDSNSEWTGPRRMKLSDITRVDFGGGYEEALAVTAPKRPKTRK